MFESLSVDRGDEFIERFYSFYDSVIRVVSIEVRDPVVCTVQIEAQDQTSPTGWSKVTLRIEGVSRFRFELIKVDITVLSSGIQIGAVPRHHVGDAKRDGIAVIFDAYPDDPGLPDLDRNMAFVVGNAVFWEAMHLE